MKSILLLSAALAVGLSGCASYSTVAHRVGVEGPAVQEQPESLAQWKVLADRMAGAAAPHLAGVAVSPRPYAPASMFDVAFHDFFVSALHERGVRVDERGGRVEIDTYPVGFPAHDRFVRNDEGVVGEAPQTELGVNVRIFHGPQMVFSGSETFYLPPRDAHNYRPLVRRHEGTPVKVVGE